MKKQLITYLVIILLSCISIVQAQNETKKWYFGGQAGLDFMPAVPAILTNGVMSPWEGCASIADGAGAILFYTDGITVYNKNHVMMANGNGLHGDGSSTQSGVIVKQPGNTNIYYIFTVAAQAGANGLKFSTVDMNLAAGNGSVTIKNTPLFTPSTEKITAVRHCNGVDVWVVTHDWNSNNFRSYLVTAAGVNLVPVLSPVGPVHTGNSGNTIGQMKASPNGRKLALAMQYAPFDCFHVADFDNTTGQVSNLFSLGNTFVWAYGVEFSPDGSKLFGGKYGGGSSHLYQWDLCAGSNAAIIASIYTVAVMPVMPMSLQLAANGKIYVCRFSQQTDGVIHNPNVMGAGCNHVDLGQSTAPRTNNLGLPNFITSYFKTPPPPFTYSVNSSVSCLTASFTPPPSPTVACASSGYSVTGLVWNFGDPGSGPLNTSTLTSPSHTYPGPGTYTAQLILNYNCGADTIKVPVTLVSPTISINTTSATCSALGSATVVAGGGSGPYSYTWSPSAQNTPVATNLTAGIYTVTVKDNGGGCVVTGTVNLGAQNLMTGTVTSGSVTCNGGSNATATLNITGGSGNYSYTWSPSAQSTSVATNLSAQVYTVTANDNNNSCVFSQTFQIAQPNALTLTAVANTPTACASNSITLSANTTGGTGPAYTYTWLPNTVSANMDVSQTLGGNYTYSVNSLDANSCLVTNTISVSFINNPTVTTVSSTICIGATATISAAGATSYLWNPGALVGANINVNPLVNTTYTVTGSNGACSSTATASVFVNALPTPTALSNSPICEGVLLQLNGSGGVSYNWQGPAAFSSVQQNTSIASALPTNSGQYTLSVLDANGCAASTTVDVIVNPTPIVTALGSTVCINSNINLTAGGATTYEWNGPLGFNALLQNPNIANATANMSGSYTVTGTSAQGCTQTAVADVLVISSPTIVVVGTNTVCSQNFNGSPNNITLSAAGANSFVWTLPMGFSATPNLNSTVINLTPPVTGVLSIANLTVVGTAGTCTSSGVFSVTVLPNPTITPIPSSATVCLGTSVQLAAIGADTYVWSPANTLSSSTGASVTASPLVNTVYSIIGSSLGCNSPSELVNVNIASNPTITITPLTPTICAGSSVGLTASGATSYTWSPAASLNTAFGSVVNATPFTTTNYVVIGSLNSCTAMAVRQVSVIQLPTLQANANRTVLCVGQSALINANGADSYQWSPSIGLNNSNSNFVTASPVNSTTYQLVGSNGICSATISVPITVLANPILNLSTSNNKICEGASTTIFASGAQNYIWTPSDGINLNNPTIGVVSPSVTTNYTVVGANTAGTISCLMTKEITIIVVPQVKSSASGSVEICAGESVRLAAGGGNTFIWVPTSGLNNGYIYNPYANPLSTTVYSVMVSNDGFCSSTATVLVKVNPMPEVDAGPDFTINADEPIYLNASGTGSLTWVFGDGIHCKSCPQTQITPNASGCYKIEAVTPFGCKAIDEVCVEITKNYNVYIPNSFTPNFDGTNDIFMVYGTGISEIELVIFDRWGEKLFTSTEQLKGWDGTFKGIMSKNDAYVYLVNFKTLDGKKHTRTGHVTLMK